MEALIYFLIWGALIFLMMRFGCGAHLMGGRHGGSKDAGSDGSPIDAPRWVAPKKATDPVCGTTVVTANGKSSVFEGNAYFFCSRDCREIFEAAPNLYLGGASRTSKSLLEQPHVGS